MKRMSQAVEVRRLIDQILDGDPGAQIVVAGDFNATPDEVPVLAIRGNVEDTGNADLATRVLVPIENTIPEPARYTLYHQGKGQMLDHMLITRNLLAAYRGSEIHNELLHDESLAFATDLQYPESGHAPVVATSELQRTRQDHPGTTAPGRRPAVITPGTRTAITRSPVAGWHLDQATRFRNSCHSRPALI